MSEKCITEREFEIYRSAQRDTHKAIGKSIEQNQKDTKDIKEMVLELTQLIRDRVDVLERMQAEHEIRYNNDRDSNNKRFTDLAQRQEKIVAALDEREGVYKAAKNVKWALSLVFVGLLAAFSKDLYQALSSKQSTPQPPTNITEDK